MTNGEKLCIDFPDVEIVAIVPNEIVVIKKLDNISMYSNQSFSYKWWNTKYKEPVIRDNGVKNELNRVKNELESTTKNNVAQERYQDLIEYFGDEKVAKTILEDRKEFKAWLERLRWNVKRADELARKLEALEQEPILDKIRAEIDVARFIDKDTKLCKNANASGLELAMQIIDKYKAESEE